MNQTIQMHIL